MEEQLNDSKREDIFGQEINKEELLNIAYNFGEKGLIFPAKITREDFAVILYNAYNECKTLKTEDQSMTYGYEGNKNETIEDSFYLQIYQRIFEYQDEKYYYLLKNELIKQASNNANTTMRIQQVLKAFEDGLYYPCACAVTTMIEGTLGETAKSAETSMKKLINSVSFKVNHPEKDYILNNLKGFISVLTKSLNFINDSEPTILNRHWLLHGRIKKEIRKIDCLILLNAFREILELLNGFVPEDTSCHEKEIAI